MAPGWKTSSPAQRETPLGIPLPSSMRAWVAGGSEHVAPEMLKALTHSTRRHGPQHRTRTASSRIELEERVAALEAEVASLKEQALTAPVVHLVNAGRIAEARQLVRLLLQAAPSSGLSSWEQVLAPPVVHAEAAATGVRLARSAEWLRAHAETHAGQWVALRDGVLIDADVSRVTLQRRLAQGSGLAGITFARL